MNELFPSDEIVIRLNKVVEKLARKKLVIGFSLEYGIDDIELLKMHLAAEINKLFLEGKIRQGEVK